MKSNRPALSYLHYEDSDELLFLFFWMGVGAGGHSHNSFKKTSAMVGEECKQANHAHAHTHSTSIGARTEKSERLCDFAAFSVDMSFYKERVFG